MSATVINAHTRVQGSILVGDPPGSGPTAAKLASPEVAGGDLVIEGIVEGDVRASGQLTIGRRAKVGGQICAHDVRIGGVLHQSVIASGVIHLLPSAEVHGDLEAARVVIDDGAVFEGQVRLLRDKIERPATKVPGPSPSPARPNPQSSAPQATQTVRPQPTSARPVPELSSPGRRRLQRRAP